MFNAGERPVSKLLLPLSLSFPICQANDLLGREVVIVELFFF